MTLQKGKIRVGILGCGAIGSRIARSIKDECSQHAVVSSIFDIDRNRSVQLSKNLSAKKVLKTSVRDVLKDADLVVEAVNASDADRLVLEALRARKDVLVMSVGKLLRAKKVFELAKKNRCQVIIPSGAIAGVDAIKAGSLAGITKITLTTRKPPASFLNNPYVLKKKIDLDRMSSETVIFEGKVDEAVRHFPQNINVAATVALASLAEDKITIRIITSTAFTKNSHELEILGSFGRITTKTENEVCPDNPKTSYLAVLSGIRALKQYFEYVKIGT